MVWENLRWKEDLASGELWKLELAEVEKLLFAGRHVFLDQLPLPLWPALSLLACLQWKYSYHE